MKKLFVSTIMLIGLAFSSQAQEKSAIGVRLSSNDGFGAEASFQTNLGEKNRLELDLGFRKHGVGSYYNVGNAYGWGINGYSHNAVKLVGIYQWVFDIKNGFKWYVGPGVGAGFYSAKDYYKWDELNDKYIIENKSGAFGVVAANGGVEYNFDFPLRVSFDVRPEVYLSPEYVDARDNNLGAEVGISARYRF